MAKEYPYSSQYGARELVEYIGAQGHEYEKIVITDRYDQPYILLLFYLKYSPQQFQGNHVLTGRDEFGFSTVREFDKFVFASINLLEAKSEYPNSLIVGTDEEISGEGQVVTNIYFPNGEIAYQMYRNKL